MATPAQTPNVTPVTPNAGPGGFFDRPSRQLPSVQQVISDPNFHGLPTQEQINVMKRIDGNFANLPEASQIDVVNRIREKGPQSYQPLNTGGVSVSAGPEPWSYEWLKQKMYNGADKVLDLIPTAAAAGGGILGFGAGGPGGSVAGATIGGGGGKAAQQLARRAIFPNSSENPETASDAAEEIGGEGIKQGVYQGIGEGLGKVAGPVVKKLSATNVRGIPMLPSEASGSPAMGGVETLLKKSLPSSGPMEEFAARQAVAINRQAADLATRISRYNGPAEDLGNFIKNGMAQYQKDYREQVIDPMYKAIDDMTASTTQRVPVEKEFQSSIVDEFGKPMTGTRRVLVPQQVGGVRPDVLPLQKVALSLLRELESQSKLVDPQLLANSKSILQQIVNAERYQNFSVVQGFRSDMGAIARQLEDPSGIAGKRAGLAKKLNAVADDVMEAAARKAEADGTAPGLLTQVRAANATYKDFARKFNTQLFTQVLSKDTPAETVSNLVRNASLSDIRDFRAVMGQQGQRMVTGQILRDLVSESAGQPLKLIRSAAGQSRFVPASGQVAELAGRNGVKISGSAFDQALNTIGPDKLKLLMGPDYAAVNNFRNVIKYTGQQPGQVMKYLSWAYNGYFLSAPVTGQAVGAASSAGFLRFVANVMTKPEAGAKLITFIRATGANSPRAVELAVKELQKLGETPQEFRQRTGAGGTF